MITFEFQEGGEYKRLKIRQIAKQRKKVFISNKYNLKVMKFIYEISFNFNVMKNPTSVTFRLADIVAQILDNL